MINIGAKLKACVKELSRSISKLKSSLHEYFVADGTDNDEVRKKHLRIAGALAIGIVAILGFAIILTAVIDKPAQQNTDTLTHLTPSESGPDTTKIDIKNLATGVNTEQLWLERAEQEIWALKSKEDENNARQSQLSEYVNTETISKKDLAVILKDFEEKIEAKYTDQLKQMEQQQNPTTITNPIEVITPKIKTVRKIGSYIPAGSYVEAKMISGVDAGIGIVAEADPRQVLLRITGKAISAGYGKDYLTTNALLGCVVQCQAIGDLSSEKAYLKPVVMTCARTASTVIEIPVKGYVTSNGKVGIRGEIVSREGDLVVKSFLSGLVGGLGSGISQGYEPGYALSNGFAVKSGAESVKNILGQGLGKGIGESSNRLSDYLIKRAEQYQPVISINEGVSVDLVFQEGFSLEEVDDAK